MTWVKLSDTFAEDPRLERAGTEALALHVAALCYCMRLLTDGVLTRRKAMTLWALDDPRAAIDALVREGLWVAVDEGYVITDFTTDQRSRIAVEKDRQLKAERQKRWLEKKSGRSGKGSTEASDQESSDSSRDASHSASKDGLVDLPPPSPALNKAGRARPAPADAGPEPPSSGLGPCDECGRTERMCRLATSRSHDHQYRPARQSA